MSRNIFLMSMVSGFTNGSEWFTIAGTLGAGTFKASLGHCKKKRVNLKKGKEKKGEKSRRSCRARSYLYKSKSRNGTSMEKKFFLLVTLFFRRLFKSIISKNKLFFYWCKKKILSKMDIFLF